MEQTAGGFCETEHGHGVPCKIFTRSHGAVLQDDKGGFIAASNEKLEHVSNAAAAEAYALGHGFLFAQQLGISKLNVKSDCLEVINTMNE